MADPIATQGPWLTAALLCDRVLEEKDATLTVVRIVDRIVSSAIGQGTPAEMPPLPVNLILLIALKSGAAHGRHDLKVELEGPDGLRTPVVENISVLFEGEDRGANLQLALNWVAAQEGLYWFNVLLNERLLSRVPLRVVYVRQETGATPRGG